MSITCGFLRCQSVFGTDLGDCAAQSAGAGQSNRASPRARRTANDFCTGQCDRRTCTGPDPAVKTHSSRMLPSVIDGPGGCVERHNRAHDQVWGRPGRIGPFGAAMKIYGSIAVDFEGPLLLEVFHVITGLEHEFRKSSSNS